MAGPIWVASVTADWRTHSAGSSRTRCSTRYTRLFVYSLALNSQFALAVVHHHAWALADINVLPGRALHVVRRLVRAASGGDLRRDADVSLEVNVRAPGIQSRL